MNSVLFLYTGVLLACAVTNGKKIVMNEEKLIGTCTGTCEDIPKLYDKHGCERISKCKTSSIGWVSGFAKCDFCKCNCKEELNVTDAIVEKKPLSVGEYELYGICTGVCDQKKGLVRTDFMGCHQVRNCKKAGTGSLSGFVRCDYCTCKCIKQKNANKYTLKNVKYDLSQMEQKQGTPSTLAQTILENGSAKEQEVTRVITYSDSRTTSMTTSHNVGHGLTITVEATAAVPGLVSLKSSVASQINYGFTSTAGKSNTIKHDDQIRAAVSVPANSMMNATIVGQRVVVDIPYTADLETTYEDGTTKTKPITGVYNNVDTGSYRVQYGKAVPFEKTEE